MRIGIISNTYNLVRSEIYQIFEGVELILHAGDIGELEAIAPIRAVLGNNDYDLPSVIKK